MVPVVPPVLIIKSRAVPSPSIVEPKVTLLSVVVNVVSVLKVTAPVYVCVEEVVTFAPRLEVVDTDKVDNPVAAPSRFNAPVMIKALVPPATVVPKLTVDAVNVLVPPDKVTAPVYVCVDEVVTFAPRLDVPDTDSEVALLIAWLRSKDPVISITPKVLLPPIIPSNCNSEAVTVRLFVSSVSELTVVSKVI